LPKVSDTNLPKSVRGGGGIAKGRTLCPFPHFSKQPQPVRKGTSQLKQKYDEGGKKEEPPCMPVDSKQKRKKPREEAQLSQKEKKLTAPRGGGGGGGVGGGGGGDSEKKAGLMPSKDERRGPIIEIKRLLTWCDRVVMEVSSKGGSTRDV